MITAILILWLIGIAGWVTIGFNRHQWALRNAKHGPVKGYNCD